MPFKMTFYLIALLSLASIPEEAMSREFIFEVSNNSELTMVNLQITEDGVHWFDFKNVNLKPNSSAEFSWSASPKNYCQQYIRGNFQTLEWSEPVAINFCEARKLIVVFGKK